MFVLVSDRTLSLAELALIDHMAEEYERPTDDDIMSFEEATGGRATMTTLLPETR